MSYSSITVANIVKRLNTQYFLPAIQREFVWDKGRVVSLFDSIMKGYPISSFLFWQLEYENRDRWGIYKFIENAKKGMSHNELANLDGIREPILVIDGQQRLTSFLIGLKGCYSVKKLYMHKNNPDAWEKQRLYLDILKDFGVEENDDLVSPSYGFRFFENPPENSENHIWFKVGKILDYENETQYISFKQQVKNELAAGLGDDKKMLFERNLDLLYSSIWRNQSVNYYLETNQEYDRALDIFVRANERGEPLGTSDLLLSIMTSKWKILNAKEEVNKLIDYLNNSLGHYNDFIKNFIMKTCLVTADLPVAYKVQNYTQANLETMETNWPKVKDSVERSVKCINSFGIDGNNLTAKNALIPIIYYFYQNPDLTLMTGSENDIKNAAAVRRWLIIMLLNNVFGGSSDSILTNIRSVQQNNDKKETFPFSQINKKVSESGRRSEFDIESFMSITYREPKSFLALSVLYDDNNWGDKTIHRDHIFPESRFEYLKMAEIGLGTQYEVYQNICNKIANLELLTQQENLEKLNKPFDEWIMSRDVSFKKRHLIPENAELWKFENFEQFIEEREKLIADRLDTVFEATAK